jgi:hypothetical protein
MDRTEAKISWMSLIQQLNNKMVVAGKFFLQGYEMFNSILLIYITRFVIKIFRYKNQIKM